MDNRVNAPNIDGESKINKDFPASVNKKLIEADVEKERLNNDYYPKEARRRSYGDGRRRKNRCNRRLRQLRYRLPDRWRTADRRADCRGRRSGLFFAAGADDPTCVVRGAALHPFPLFRREGSGALGRADPCQRRKV